MISFICLLIFKTNEMLDMLLLILNKKKKLYNFIWIFMIKNGNVLAQKKYELFHLLEFKENLT